ncbi:7-methylguanosine phosphate-specific 5'-nucleotidase [Zootoca vivipara]|uniref:7-methylguanosine phosphate-specific 5'-nucleotidase n=1 Tax=Zootoca vivipara TaxID=8524 RepID=UPI00293BECB3|nr:7-methylguanosine phosphate-specific 5'-nucleotidase [Zootoca vivipara]
MPHPHPGGRAEWGLGAGNAASKPAAIDEPAWRKPLPGSQPAAAAAKNSAQTPRGAESPAKPSPAQGRRPPSSPPAFSILDPSYKTPRRPWTACWAKIMVPELEKATVRMKDPERVKNIISALRKGGVGKFQVISDFDMTLTRFGFNGRRCPTSYNIIDNSRVISEEGKEKLKDLLHHYYPIEIDPYRTMEDKLPLMIEWWTKAHDLLAQQKIKKSDIAQVVKESDVMLRDGFNLLFDQLHQNKVPLFIFSAGVGDVLEEIIRQAGAFYPNVKVVSNYMDFDSSGVLRGFKEPLIHTYNKNNTVLKDTEYFQQLCTRTNILLLGDSMGDLTMADGVVDVENILRVGFLNDRVEEQRGKYLEAYDIVLEKDETLDVANGILRFVLAETAQATQPTCP